MTSMFESMTSSSDDPIVTTLFLTGPPGSGKTQLARQFGEQFSKDTSSCENSHPLVLTLNADSVQSLLKSIKDVTNKLGLMTKPKKTEGFQNMHLVRFYLAELRRFLQTYGGQWLLILDNMFHGEEINCMFPQPGSKNWGPGKVLVTSQDNDVAPACHHNGRMLSLNNGMSRDDALNLLECVSGVNVDDFAVKLAEELGFFPLALACSATYVGQTRQDRVSSSFSWEHFLALYRQQKGTLGYRTFSENNMYPNSMAVAARLAAKRMAERSDVLRLTFDFLSYCVLYPVPLVLLAKYVDATLPPSSPRPYEEIEAEICRCSLLIHACSGFSYIETVKFHQVMTDAFQHTKEERGDNNEGKFVGMLKFLNENLKPTLDISDQLENIALKILMRPHLNSFVAHGNAKNWNSTAEFVLISAKVGQFLYNASDFPVSKALECLQSTHDIARKLQLTDAQYCDILANLGFYYMELYMLEKSVDILKQAYAMTEGQISKEWLILKSRILRTSSLAYFYLEKHEIAVERMKRSIDIAKKVFSEDEVEKIMDRLVKLAFFYVQRYEIGKVKEVITEAQSIIAHTSSDKRLKRADALSSLGLLYFLCSAEDDSSGNALLTTARNFHSKSLEIYEEVLGKNIFSCTVVAYKLVVYSFLCEELHDSSLSISLLRKAEKIFSHSQDNLGLSIAAAYKKNILRARSEIRGPRLANSNWVTFLAPLFVESRIEYCRIKNMMNDVLDDCKSEKTTPSCRYVEQLKKLRSATVKQLWDIWFVNALFWVLFLSALDILASYCGKNLGLRNYLLITYLFLLFTWE